MTEEEAEREGRRDFPQFRQNLSLLSFTFPHTLHVRESECPQNRQYLSEIRQSAWHFSQEDAVGPEEEGEGRREEEKEGEGRREEEEEEEEREEDMNEGNVSTT